MRGAFGDKIGRLSALTLLLSLVFAAPAAADGLVVVGGLDGSLYAFPDK